MEIREQDQYDTLNGWRVVDAAAITQFVYPGTIYSWGPVFPQMPRAPYLSRLFNIFQEGKDIQREQNAVGWRMSTYSYDI
ncbi:hypothetical protein FOXG_22200 [Fusarium oxysporum f. sp. lycopersici 4287]|uniref:Uncharacterized protein n=1 Tax=Fusarium oxysporum f. sp. lycopersici (strain 4287 / CBS 123668 / FGSC 9935 / NRRL 34936) TaxID=426428 RepID=A0A0J9W4X7_FUSO4|nr:hypothetical protein FOXG_22065 [Fusarium oxysporum f. sp. lycopersici 4287]XP_018256395.1 uncharacterized protein FOXG_22200 [Fusarium oxysporum f. sp. lycopersici 4287]KNB17836.1 hypothetical protein FOXG_22065 [Fusarium oxysporum f. sp. lycopersici 4287]KNB18350.1 hypothetical protein FOXG_22200 [Fusarium oxysporum f. sp. lycopersici 4287]